MRMETMNSQILEPGEYTVTEQDEAEIDEDYVDVFDGDESVQRM